MKRFFDLNKFARKELVFLNAKVDGHTVEVVGCLHRVEHQPLGHVLWREHGALVINSSVAFVREALLGILEELTPQRSANVVKYAQFVQLYLSRTQHGQDFKILINGREVDLPALGEEVYWKFLILTMPSYKKPTDFGLTDIFRDRIEDAHLFKKPYGVSHRKGKRVEHDFNLAKEVTF